MIDLLDQATPGIAEEILRVSLESYEVEANLIGSADFPPLSETVGDIEKSRNCFYGYACQGQILGIVELEETGDTWIIARLVVSPKYFRRGIASQLV